MKRSLFLLQDSYVLDHELSVFGDRIDDGMEYSSLTRQKSSVETGVALVRRFGASSNLPLLELMICTVCPHFLSTLYYWHAQHIN